MSPTIPQCPIAIVGISVELPSGSDSAYNLDHKSFFDFLLSGKEAYEPVPPERFNIETWKGTGVGRIHVDKGSFLKEIDTFDNVEFGISSRDAYYMAPATRKLIEHSFLALLDSGIDYRSKRVGVFTSATSIEMMNVSEPDELDCRGSFAGYPAMVANRISNHLDLLGPSLPVDTACSSTLTAMHLAVQAIASGDCNAAVVGGCQLNHRFIDWFTYSQGSLLAKDGKCKPFDSNADGFARAEACGVVVIKPLEDAIRDQDRIYATILGTAINSTGGAAAPGAPVGESQCDAMIQAFKRAGRDPREVDYIELHATGTAKGDPTEANWVGEHFHREDELLIGSVKANIGHTEIVAFLASLSKVISIFEQKVIPPQINIKKLNPAIKWEDYRLKVPRDVTPLTVRNQAKSLVAISSSGIGGSNGHVVLETPPADEEYRTIATVVSEGPLLLMVGALSSRTVSATTDAIRGNLSEYASDMRGLSTVLGRRSKQGTWRSYGIVGPNSTVLSEFTAPIHTPRTPNPIVFVFSGQGPQHKDMGRELFQQFPVFRQSVLEMDAIFEKVTGKSIVRDYGLFDNYTTSSLPEIWPIALVLPSIAIFQMALFDLLTSLGIKPEVVVGHSAGETAVLYASGAAPKSMAVELAIIRGQSFTPIEQLGGTMAALSCTPDVLGELLEDQRKATPDALVELACYNSPSAVAIAGEETAIDAVVAAASARGIFARKIRTKVPFHSSMMESSKEVYTAALETLFNRYPGVHIPKTPTFSTCTGTLFAESFDAQYYWSNTRSPVQFTQTIGVIGATYHNATFVELSPNPVLSPYVQSMVSETSAVYHSVQRPNRGNPSTEQMDVLHLLGKVTSAGYNDVDFTMLNGRAYREFTLPLPAYPFIKKKYPLYPDTPGTEKQMEVFSGPLNHSYLRMNKDTHPLLAEHVIRGQPIMPAAAFLEMALEFGASTLINVNFRSMLSLSSEKPVKVNINLEGAYWAVKSTPSISRRGGPSASNNQRLHADGYLSFEAPKHMLPLDIEDIRNRCPGHVEAGFYPSLSYFSSYGPSFQRVTNMYYNDHEALASIKGLDHLLQNDGKYFLHPAILDACIHIPGYKPFSGDYNPNVYYLPSHVDAFIVHQGLKQAYFPRHVYAHVQLKKWQPDAIIYDVCIAEDSGKRLCTFVGFKLAKHRLNPVVEPSRPLEVVMQPAFHSIRREPMALCSHPDRSILFSTLDKMAVHSNTYPLGVEGAVNMMQLHPKLRDETWGPYFDSVGNKGLSPPKDLQFDQIIKCVLESFRCALNAFQISSTRVIQLLISSNVETDLFRLGIEKILQDFQSIYTEISIDVGNGHTWQTIKPASGLVHNVILDFENPKQITEDRLFDIALFFNVASGKVSPNVIAESAYTFLVPGGTFILAEKNLDAWNDLSLGTVWYDTVFGTLQASEVYGFPSYQKAMKKFSILRVHKSQDADPFHFCMEAQKPTWSASEGGQLDMSLFSAEESFAYHYSFGKELELQWELSGLNTEQSIEVWIMTTEGIGSEKGMVRALRKEYSAWKIRLVIFPATFKEEAREDFLRKLPLELRHEEEIVVSGELSNVLLVSRVVPIQPIELRPTEQSPSKTLPNHSVLIKMLSFSKQGLFSGVLGCVVEENATVLERNQLVVGLVVGPIDEYMVVDSAAFSRVPPCLTSHVHTIPVLVPGFVSAIVAFGLSAFSRPHRLNSCRILLTHADTSVGLSISKLALKNGLHVKEVAQNASLYDLSQLQAEQYDMVISGYTDSSYVQILRLLLKSDVSQLFLWNDEQNGLSAIVKRDPYSVGDALSYAFNTMGEDFAAATIPRHMLAMTESPAKNTSLKPVFKQSRYDPQKTYIILGGIGTLGAHLALFLYERGARHITLTSRSGKKSLDTNTNGIVRRIFDYLNQREDLEISLLAVDGTDIVGMSSMLDGIGHSNLGGCFLLAAVLSDGIFSHLRESDFLSVYAAKLEPLTILRRVISLDSLDFVIAFTSTSGIFGGGGQTNYGAANTTLEEEIMLHRNAFSFICPGVLDSTLMIAGTGETTKTRLSTVIPWSVTSEDTITWLDDAMYRYQNGQRIIRYVPDLDWQAMDRAHGMSRIGKHLVPNTKEITDPDCVLDEAEQIAKIVKTVLDIPEGDFSPEVPFTAYGIDSLSASRLSFLLRPFVKVTQIQLLGEISISDLVASARNDATETVEMVNTQKPTNSRKRTDIMIDMLAKYSLDIAPSPPSQIRKLTVGSPEFVFVTGTTGTLGSNLLAQLLQNDEVKTVYAFNRPATNGNTSQTRHRDAFVRQGLSLTLLASSKLVFLEGDLTKENFGLSDATFQTLLSSITHIIHNAWNIDIMIPLEAHEDSICATRKLLDFVVQSSCVSQTSMSFISTIGIYQNAKDTINGGLPEETVLNPSISSGQSGYIESKWVAERLVQLATDAYGLSTNILRVGLLTGGLSGHWDPSHWFPAIVESASYLGCLPDGSDTISWVPVNLAASAIIDMRHTEHSVHHIIHPKPTTWNTIMKSLSEILNVPLVPYLEWYSRLESGVNDEYEDDRSEQAMNMRAALRMTQFFRMGVNRPKNTESMGLLANVASEKGFNASKALQSDSVCALTSSDTRRWVEQWRKIGFLPHLA